MVEKPRILSPEGEIIRILISKPLQPTEIAERARISRASVYNNLKDLLLAGWVVREGDVFRVTGAGVRAYFAEVLLGVDADSLLGYCRVVGLSPLELVELGVRLVMVVVEAAYIPADLARLLSTYDPSALEKLEGIFGRKAEVVA